MAKLLFSLSVLGALTLIAMASAALTFLVGFYDVAATTQHFQSVHRVLEEGMRRSVQRQSRDITVPEGLSASDRVRAGATLYKAHCVVCHGSPGVAPGVVGMSMQPVPGPLVDAGDKWKAGDLYWIVRHGIKMSGMPAWGHHLSEDEIWNVVAFIQAMPQLPPESASSATSNSTLSRSVLSIASGDIAAGRIALTQYACQSCHMIPGITGPRVYIGPPLEGMGKRQTIAGRLPNTPENMVRWIMDPQAVDRRTAMPDMGVSPQHAAEMAAYLATLR